MKNYREGFTLIELLLVVAIIGILSAIILSSLSGAKGKSNNAAIQSNLASVRNQAELFYNLNSNSYLPSGGSTLLVTTPCPSYSGASTNMFTYNKTISDAIAQAVQNGGNSSACYNSATAWAVAIGLKDGGTAGDAIADTWCVDSTGASRSYTWTSGQTITNSINATACR